MALDTLAELKLAIIDSAHRSITDDRLNRFICLAETEMVQNPIQILKVRSGETRSIATMDTTSRFLALPDGFKQQRRLRLILDVGFSELIYRTPEQLDSMDGPGMPCFFTVTSQLEFDRVPDEAYTLEMQYWADFTPLSDSNTTNPVLTNNPNIYLFGALKEFYAYSEDTEQELKHEQKFVNAIKGANKKYREGRYGSSPVMAVER